jgi:catechol 2,3-dioxygenase-like lactoylglutathione lyase family enzyme
MNKVVHFEIPADDIAKAKTFYGNVFGWEFKAWSDEYSLAITAKSDEDDNPLTRRASDQARCIVRAGGLREIDAGGPRLVRKLENFGLLFMRLLRPFGKGWCPVGAAERHPARNAGLSRQSGWCSPVMEGSKCPTRHRHDSAKKRRGTPG